MAEKELCSKHPGGSLEIIYQDSAGHKYCKKCLDNLVCYVAVLEGSVADHGKRIKKLEEEHKAAIQSLDHAPDRGMRGPL